MSSHTAVYPSSSSTSEQRQDSSFRPAKTATMLSLTRIDHLNSAPQDLYTHSAKSSGISVSLAGVCMKLWSHRLKSGGQSRPVPWEERSVSTSCSLHLCTSYQPNTQRQ
ncbi:hypothetical protein R3I94_022184 [Phoxinus phoxinus]